MKMTTENMKRFEDMVKNFADENNLAYRINQDFENNMSNMEFSIRETRSVRRVVVTWDKKRSLSEAGAAVFAYITREFNLDDNSGGDTLEVKNVIFNNPATIVMWGDGTKTVVKTQDGDLYSKEHGLAMCIAKKALGNKGNFNEVFKKWIPEETRTKVTEEDKGYKRNTVVSTIETLAEELKDYVDNAIRQLRKEG